MAPVFRLHSSPDHCPQRSPKFSVFFDNTQLSRRHIRWSQYLNGFDYRIQHRSGRLNGKADALTHRPEYYSNSTDESLLQQSMKLLPPELLISATHQPASLLYMIDPRTTIQNR